MSETDAKWACEYCTYENYPSSIKCTMCRGPKPFVSEDIYRLHGSDDKLTSNAAGPCDNKTKRKWTCDTCMASNTSRDQICQQCGGPQQVSANNLHEHIQPLKISSQHSDLAQSLSRSRNSSPPTITNLENSRRTQGKWICVVSATSLFFFFLFIQARRGSPTHVSPIGSKNIFKFLPTTKILGGIG
jgi:ubiquitin thioesterase ZRANB1